MLYKISNKVSIMYSKMKHQPSVKMGNFQVPNNMKALGLICVKTPTLRGPTAPKLGSPGRMQSHGWTAPGARCGFWWPGPADHMYDTRTEPPPTAWPLTRAPGWSSQSRSPAEIRQHTENTAGTVQFKKCVFFVLTQYIPVHCLRTV